MDAEILSIAQIERDPGMLPRIEEFVHNTFPIVADPQEISSEHFEIFSVYLIDKKGVLRTYLPGGKEARPRLDVILTELAKIEGVQPPPMKYDAGEVLFETEDEPVAAAPPLAEGASPLSARWMWSHDKVHPGDRFKLAFVLDAAPGYRVYANNEDKMTPLQIQIETPKGIEQVGEIEYPASVTKTDPVLQAPLSFFEGRIPLGVIHFRASDSIDLAEHRVTARVKYQACNNSICLAPSTLSIEMPIQAVSRDTKTRTVAGSKGW